MARQALPILGQVVGGMVGGPWGAAIGGMLGSAIGNMVDPLRIYGPELGEGLENRASEGGFRPIVLGRGQVGVCMIHEGPMIKRRLRHQQGKGGGPVQYENRAYRTMAFALGESAYPDTGVVLMRLWVDGKLRYDATPTSEITEESADFAQDFTFYPGHNTQQPDPDVEAFMGAGNAPSYRGGCPYIVFPEWDVTDSQGRGPVVQAELATLADIQLPSRLLVGRRVDGLEEWNTSSDGYLWGAWTPVDGGISPHFLASNADRFVGWATSIEDRVGYFESPEDGWEPATGASVSTTGWPKVGWGYEETFAIPNASDLGVTYSTNGGTHFEVAEVAQGSTTAFRTAAGWVSINTRTREIYRGSTIPSLAYVGQYDHELMWMAYSVHVHNGIAMIGGRLFDGTPAVMQSNGITFSGEVIPLFSTPNVVCGVAAGDIDGDVWWVAVAESGEVGIRNPAGGWSYGPNFGAFCSGVAWSGDAFYAIGASGSAGTTTGYVKRLNDDMSAWLTVLSQEHNTTAAGWGGIGALQLGSRVSTARKMPLSMVVAWLHDRVGVGRCDVSQLTDMVVGVVFASNYSAADAIRAGSTLYNYDMGEYDTGNGVQINYVKRGAPALMTLTEDDVVEGPEEWRREDAYERPRSLHVAYPNPDADYAAPNITIKRTSPDVKVVGERSVSTGFVFTDVDEITRRADVLMTLIYSEIAGTYEIILPWSLLDLAPTDVIGYSIRGQVRRLRIDKWRFAPDGTLRIEAWADRQSAITSNVTGLPVPRTRRPPPSLEGPTISAALDLPAIVDALDSLHLMVAASGQSPAWHGSIHQRRLPTDADFSTVAVFNAPTTVMGLLQSHVTAASPSFTDTTNIIRVQLYTDDEFQSFTHEQFLSENGAIALSWDDAGQRRWEICQYRDAVKVGERTWELTTLLRGVLSTGAAAHPPGSLLVLLDVGLRVVPMQASMLGQDVTHRAVSNGQLADNATPYVEAYTGQSQREWGVEYFQVEQDGDDFILSWVPRHRFGTDVNPIASANFDGFRVGWESTGVIHQEVVAGNSIRYTLPGASDITFAVAPRNRITGEGPESTVYIP